MKSKSEVLEKFKEYKAFVENFHGLKIQSLRSDNGGEYVNEEFNDFLKINGITRQLTIPRTPEQNGIAEKMNHTLFDMTRCLLLDSKIPINLWADTVTTACYLRNKCPSKAINGNIPEELWTGKRVTLDHLRIFGCKVYAHIDKTQQEGKLGKRSQECILIGYGEKVKGYKLWNPESDKFFVSRNVRFEETVFPFGKSTAGTQREMEDELMFYLNEEDNARRNTNLQADPNVTALEDTEHTSINDIEDEQGEIAEDGRLEVAVGSEEEKKADNIQEEI